MSTEPEKIAELQEALSDLHKEAQSQQRMNAISSDDIINRIDRIALEVTAIGRVQQFRIRVVEVGPILDTEE